MDNSMNNEEYQLESSELEKTNDSDVVIDIQKMYLADISKYPLLAPEQEVYYATMLQHPEEKKLLVINEIDKYVVTSMNTSLLFRSLGNNSNYKSIIEDLIAFYCKLNSRSDQEIERLEKYQNEANRLGRALNIDELKSMFHIVPGDTLNEEELAIELKKFKDYKFAFDKMFVSNLRLVVSIAIQKNRNDYDLIDLINEGNLGLMKAITRFDVTKGFKFSTYATWWIKQAISRFMINNSSDVRIPEHKAHKINSFKNQVKLLEQEEQRTLSPQEIADRLDMPVEIVLEYQRLLSKIVSLDESVSDEEEFSMGSLIPSSYNLEDEILHNALKEEITEIFKVLTPKEIIVIKMRFGLCEYDGVMHPLEVVGKKIHVSPERVRQIEKDAFIKIKHFIRRNVKVKALKEYC